MEEGVLGLELPFLTHNVLMGTYGCPLYNLGWNPLSKMAGSAPAVYDITNNNNNKSQLARISIFPCEVNHKFGPQLNFTVPGTSWLSTLI